jgi:hypothetical protein
MMPLFQRVENIKFSILQTPLQICDAILLIKLRRGYNIKRQAC